ncbi:MAG: ribonuclease P protein component [Candidatus Promineifilaceae bacterium]|nr:ribonuclease P protein component [Candidatus Promineifilaceae bacterium]
MLPQAHRLRRSEEIRQVRREGNRWQHPLLTLYTRPTGQQSSRIAISVSRRVGNAVVRNRCKRRVREVVRQQLPQINCGWDCLFIARDRLAGAPYAEVEAAVKQLLQRASLLPHSR